MNKVKILKAKTFVKVMLDWGAGYVEYLPHDSEGFEDFDFALMHCQNDCVCEKSIPTDCDFYFKLIGPKNDSYTGRCFVSEVRGNLGFYEPVFFESEPPTGYYILTSYCPSSLEDGELYGDNLVHTSDGVIELNIDNFLVNKNGEITSTTPEDVLSIFSKRKVKVSPSYKELRVSASRTRPTKAAVGTMIYNQTTGQLEFRGKNGWERITTENIK